LQRLGGCRWSVEKCGALAGLTGWRRRCAAPVAGRLRADPLNRQIRYLPQPLQPERLAGGRPLEPAATNRGWLPAAPPHQSRRPPRRTTRRVGRRVGGARPRQAGVCVGPAGRRPAADCRDATPIILPPPARRQKPRGPGRAKIRPARRSSAGAARASDDATEVTQPWNPWPPGIERNLTGLRSERAS